MIPKVEVNYDLPLSADVPAFVSLRFGVGYRYQIRNKSVLDLQATPRVKLNTSGLQFSDGGIPTNQIFDYKGLIWNFTFAIKVSLHKKAFKSCRGFHLLNIQVKRKYRETPAATNKKKTPHW